MTVGSVTIDSTTGNHGGSGMALEIFEGILAASPPLPSPTPGTIA